MRPQKFQIRFFNTNSQKDSGVYCPSFGLVSEFYGKEVVKEFGVQNGIVLYLEKVRK